MAPRDLGRAHPMAVTQRTTARVLERAAAVGTASSGSARQGTQWWGAGESKRLDLDLPGPRGPGCYVVGEDVWRHDGPTAGMRSRGLAGDPGAGGTTLTVPGDGRSKKRAPFWTGDPVNPHCALVGCAAFKLIFSFTATPETAPPAEAPTPFISKHAFLRADVYHNLFSGLYCRRLLLDFLGTAGHPAERGARTVALSCPLWFLPLAWGTLPSTGAEHNTLLQPLTSCL